MNILILLSKQNTKLIEYNKNKNSHPLTLIPSTPKLFTTSNPNFYFDLPITSDIENTTLTQ